MPKAPFLFIFFYPLPPDKLCDMVITVGKNMTKKSFVVILILSVVANYVALIVDALVTNTLIGGESGFPFKYSSSTLFDQGSVNIPMLILNILFWFVVIWRVWKVIRQTLKIIKKPKKISHFLNLGLI